MSKAIKKFAVDLHIRVGYGTAFFLLLISYLLTLYANSELLKQARLVDRSNKVIIHMEGLLSSLKDVETSARGYLLFRDNLFMAPYQRSRYVTDSLLSTLQTEILNDTIIWQDLLTLKTLIDKNHELIAANIEDFDQHQHQLTDTLRSRSFFREEVMDHIRAKVKDMQSAEQARLNGRLDEMNTRYHVLNAIIILSLILAVAMAAYGFVTYSRENKARRIADEKVTGYQEQLKQQIAELDTANKALIQMRSIEKFASTGRIARTIAHEVRNPLTNINLAVDQLKSDFNGNLPESYNMMLEMIGRNSVRINQLITDLLNSTKFTELVYKRMSINQLLDETLELARDRVLLSNISVVKHYSDDICDVAVDVERIKIAFLNIIVNAIEAMEPGTGILQLRTVSKEDKCVVTIMDNGHGIDPESQSKLFEPYYTTKNKGTGLGLTNTQNIILNHNGHIQMESEKGKGTTFTISLNFA
ncbi:MAG: CHASE3 domain-containing protein [Chitinophagaceae bacterium]|nr:CHASE3 domain-containing protein [Chitinophagaceae bacterium]